MTHCRNSRVVLAQHGLTILFTDDAQGTHPLGQASSLSVFDFGKDHFRDLHFGLKLISGNTSQNEFELDKLFANRTPHSANALSPVTTKNPDRSHLGFRNSDFEFPNTLLVRRRCQTPHRC